MARYGEDGAFVSRDQDAWAPPRVTSSGRQVRLSEKAKLFVASHTESAFWQAVREIDRYAGVVIEMMRTCSHPGRFKNTLVTWLSLYNNVKTAEVDLQKTLSLERLATIKPDILRVHERCMELRKKAYQHLDLLQLDMQEELERKSRHDVSKSKETSTRHTPSMFSPTNSLKSGSSGRSGKSSTRSSSSRKSGKSAKEREQIISRKEKSLSPKQKTYLEEKSKKYEDSMRRQIQGMEKELVDITNSLREKARTLVKQTLEKEEMGLSTVMEEPEDIVPKRSEYEIDGTKPKTVAEVYQTPNPIATSTAHKVKLKEDSHPYNFPFNPYEMYAKEYRSPEKVRRSLPKYTGVRPNSPKNAESPKISSTSPKVEPSKSVRKKERKIRKLKVDKEKTVKKSPLRSPPKIARTPISPYDRRLFTPPMDSFQQEFQEFLQWKAMKAELIDGVQHPSRTQEHQPELSDRYDYSGLQLLSRHSAVPANRRYEQTSRQEEDKIAENEQEKAEDSCEQSEYSSRNSSRSDKSFESNASSMFTKAIGALTDALLKTQENNNDKILLPKVEPKVYSGNVLSFHIWLNSFQTLIEPKISCPTRRLLYLGSYVSGDAEKAIKPLLDMPNEVDSYEKAIKKLKDRFGSRIKIAEEFKRKLKKWPPIKEGDSKHLQEYADFLGHCQTAMKSVGYLENLAQPEENVKLTEKLPVHIAARWNREVVKYMKKEESEKKEVAPYPPFSMFCEFLQTEASVAAGPCAPAQERYNAAAKRTSLSTNTSNSSDSKNNGRTVKNKKKFQKKKEFTAKPESTDRKEKNSAGSADTDKTSVKKKDDVPVNENCYMCNSSSHMIEKCPSFLNCTPQERREYLKQNVICFGCLRTKHDFRFCKERFNPLLRIVNPVNVNDIQVSNESEASSTGMSQDNLISHSIHQSCGTESSRFLSTVLPIKVAHINKPSKSVLIYALVDTQSNGTFITDEVLSKLGVEGAPTDLKLLTLNTKSVLRSTSVHGLSVSAYNKDEFYMLPTTYSKASIPCDINSIARKDMLGSFSHLKDVLPDMMDFDPSIPIGALLGYNFPAGFKPLDETSTIVGREHEPWAVKTALGWSVSGPVNGGAEPEARYCYTTQVQETSISMLRKAFDLDFLGPDTSETRSYEDAQFLRQMDEGFTIDRDGHVELPLPLREDASIPPGSRKVAYRRLMSQRRKFLAHPSIFKQYDDFINNMLAQHHAEDAPILDDDDTFAFWLPHQYVFHPRKLDEIRVVFDGSAESDGISLNDLLLPGPDLTNNLIGVLLRFREGREAFLCDIQGMFHQVRVTEKFRNLLRFFWFKNGDPNGPIVEYRVCVHLFGATSSPACATYALRKVADLYKNLFGMDVVEFITRFFYVDDGLRSVDDVDRALEIIFGAIELCGMGGFKLHKFACNNPSILSKIPSDYRCKDLQNWSQGTPLPKQMCLGKHWSMHKDCFLYLLKLTEVIPTRRGMLSFVGSIYDPLGIISPLTLYGRQLLQKLCKEKYTWDQAAPGDIVSLWNEWFLSLQILDKLMIPRCYKITVDDVTTAELHMFSDAAEEGYGACGYLVLQDSLSRRDVTLALAKSRVKPLKTITMPRLELQAAVLSVKMAEFLLSELPYDNIQVYFWCDSMIVLAYIMNDGKRFRIYVANRVQYIRDRSKPCQWRYIDTDSNPADLASRGCKADVLLGNELWFQGPQILKIPQMKQEPETYVLSEEDPEILKEKIVHTTILEKYSISLCMSDLSSWTRMVRVMNTMRKGILQWYRYLCKKKGRECKLQEEDPVQRRQKAKMCIIRNIQQECFPNEFTKIQTGYPDNLNKCKKRRMNISSEGKNLKKLDVYMCEQDFVLKVGGRVRRAEIPLELIHPCILPKKHPITNALIDYYHTASAHSGRASTINLIRESGWWIIHIRAAVEFCLKRCVNCKKLRGKVMEQKMSDLPIDRLEECPPFTYCAVDLFGPFYVKEKRTIKKRWGCLFCCLVIRAVHIEICDDMTTDSFILAYRRFVNRRGPVRSIRCDRGSNIMGARGDLDLSFSKLDHDKIKQHMLRKDCDWIRLKPNPPKSSHMGGVWERLIGSIRRSIEGLLVQHTEHLTDEGLKTLMTEAESIVNSRPLTYVDVSDPNEPKALTPFALLTMKTKRVMAPFGGFVKEDKYAKRRWRAVQYLATQFWERWKREFLPLITPRNKWQKVRADLQIDDIVLLVEDSQPRSCWPLARVVDVKRSVDDRVRSITVRTKDGEYDRPIRKVVFLYRKES